MESVTMAAALVAAVSSTLVAGAVGWTLVADWRRRRLLRRAGQDNADPIRPQLPRRERRRRRAR